MSAYNCKFPEETLKQFFTVNSFSDKLRHELCSLCGADEFRLLAEPITLCEFLIRENFLNTFSEVFKLLKIILTLPMTIVEIERRCSSNRLAQLRHGNFSATPTF